MFFTKLMRLIKFEVLTPNDTIIQHRKVSLLSRIESCLSFVQIHSASSRHITSHSIFSSLWTYSSSQSSIHESEFWAKTFNRGRKLVNLYIQITKPIIQLMLIQLLNIEIFINTIIYGTKNNREFEFSLV